MNNSIEVMFTSESNGLLSHYDRIVLTAVTGFPFCSHRAVISDAIKRYKIEETQLNQSKLKELYSQAFTRITGGHFCHKTGGFICHENMYADCNMETIA